MSPRIVLVGPMGVGKTTVGELLSVRLGCRFRDTDADIVAAEGRAISDIFAEDGEEHFRALERRAVANALSTHEGVVALGGGAVMDPGTRELLTKRPVVHLTMGIQEAAERIGLGVTRPLLTVDPLRQWRELMQARRPLYTEVARVAVSTDGQAPEEVAQAVLDALKLTQA
ncbi:shikimate kinase [Streptomyces sp. NPDC095613]|uniref:shikimate kinase n=1 Tax=Streptomyces sp. NPDC095613 TaxID=3155540 RepID=UPI003330D400